MTVTRTTTTEVGLPLDEAYDRCLEVAAAVPRASIKAADEVARTITLRVPMSVKSWGEHIALQLTSTGPSTSKVVITSRSSFPLTFLDYGKNEANVEYVLGWLATLPGGSVPPAPEAAPPGSRLRDAPLPPEALPPGAPPPTPPEE